MAETGNAIAGFSWFAFAVMFAVTAYLSLAEDALPAWVGWLSAALVPLSLVSAPIAGSAVESVTAIGLAAWVAGISVISLRGQLRPVRLKSSTIATPPINQRRPAPARPSPAPGATR